MYNLSHCQFLKLLVQTTGKPQEAGRNKRHQKLPIRTVAVTHWPIGEQRHESFTGITSFTNAIEDGRVITGIFKRQLFMSTQSIHPSD
ncbi:hypothetical protein Q8A67_002308 [Cirrhinus molitorella]|uniref:Uncharacterized protein n=1 Tax=Cirrhinus molitorella TaxID=172907 RepID=A0AA88QL28_9TELE|nr:hypothetical protein Q8A67_002308 [Cirrhinus molitorella]